MAYRRTERVQQRLKARHDALIAAARAIADEHGLQGVQIVPVAERAGIASGTVYRYFASKSALVEALIADVSGRELAAMQAAAQAAPGPLSALAASLVTFAARALAQRRLMWASIAEPVDAELAPIQGRFKEAIATEFAQRIGAASAAGNLPDADPVLLAPSILGGFIEALLAPSDARPRPDRAAAQALALCALRAAGIADARARGLIVQTAWPAGDDAAAVSAT
jgi:AcrR family transcriptional regulator